MNKSARAYLEELLLDYVNNYLTVETFAEHHELHEDEMRKLLHLARTLKQHPDM